MDMMSSAPDATDKVGVKRFCQLTDVGQLAYVFGA
jgi:hypothetical protein